MAQTNRDRIEKGLQYLRAGLGPYVDREFINKFGQDWDDTVDRYLPNERNPSRNNIENWDVQTIIKLMWESWNEVFKNTLGHSERSLLSEIRTIRNDWAHQKNFSGDDTDRALDTIARMLTAISASQAEDVNRMKHELRRLIYTEQTRNDRRRLGGTLIDVEAAGHIKPWREVVTPHPDVASGRYQQAEFAADLWQVHNGQASEEYQNPAEFFRRTYLTESLKQLLVSAVRRICEGHGDPVVQLQTNFGGGKTHSMLALYHLFSGVSASSLPGVDQVMAEASIQQLQTAKRVVLVGNKISPGNPVTKSDGTKVHTLWGELAWQLGGKAAYQVIAEDDLHATNPGDRLRELFNQYGPCLILIDEWVAYARQLHNEKDLPAGDFETQFSFAQVLTESAAGANNCLLVVSLPASDTAGSPHMQIDDIEVGGIRGREALMRLGNVVGRLASTWRPANAEEGFQIVRRRLFEPLLSDAQSRQRDLTVRAFGELYRSHASEFPAECNQLDYEGRIREAYPIHPEIFDRLYEDWSTQPKFQRTRGVLRLMAAVISCLWDKDDRAPLIMPSTIPIDDNKIQYELTRYLSDNWVPIIESDIDGPNALPKQIDAEVPNLGRIHATRRVARTIYLGSAPKTDTANNGIDDRRVRLGCVLPGESSALFGDALRRLSAQATYLYQDTNRYWYSTQPTVTKIADDRAEQLRRDPDKVYAELDARVRHETRQVGEFSKIHTMPRSAHDIPDELETRLVVLSPNEPYSSEGENLAQTFAQNILELRGTAPRLYRNTLVFLAVDNTRYQDLDEAIRKYLAWKSVVDQQEELDLDAFQRRQAQTQKNQADSNIKARLPETYQWLLVPSQLAPSDPIKWQPSRLTGTESLASKVYQRLRRDEAVVPKLAPTILRKHMDDIPLWRDKHVLLRQLIEDFARYVYLPRLLNPSVLLEAVSSGLLSVAWESETFAYAEMYDAETDTYRGIKVGEVVRLGQDDAGLLVKPDVAAECLKRLSRELIPPAIAPGLQIVGAQPLATADQVGAEGAGGSRFIGQPVKVGQSPSELGAKITRFFGEISIDPERISRDANTIANEIVIHLNSQPRTTVRIILEIQADIPDGLPQNIIRTLNENCTALKFTNHGFEE